MKNRIRVERAELRITQQHLADVVGAVSYTHLTLPAKRIV